MKQNILSRESMFPFYLIIIYLLLEFGRPQSLIPFLKVLHLPGITVGLIAISLLLFRKLYFKDIQTVLMILLLCEMIIHGPIAVNNYWAYKVFYSMLINFIAFLGIVSFIDNDLKYAKLINTWFIIFIFLAIIGIISGGKGIGSFIGDENDFCMALNMIIPFSIFGIFSAKSKIGKIYFFILSCLFILVNALTMSRGGFLGLACVGFYCWLRSNKKFILTILLGLLVIFMFIAAPTQYWDEVESIQNERSQTEQNKQFGTGWQRIYSWKIAWYQFLENPIIGVGQGNYPWNVGEIEKKMGIQWQTRSLSGRAAHSLYFTLLPELGLIGTLIYFLIVIFSIKDLIYIKKVLKKYKDLISDDETKKIYYMVLALEGSLVGFFISSIFISTLYYPNFWVSCAFIVSLKKIIHSKYDCNYYAPSKYALR